MTSDKVHELIKRGEGLTIEFKDSHILSNSFDLAKTMAAFANAEGGMILIGVKDTGEIEGMIAKRGHQEYIISVASDKCDPPIRPSFEKIRCDDIGDVHIITIPKRRFHGVKMEGGVAYFIRVGSTIRSMTTYEFITRIIDEKSRLTKPKIVRFIKPKITMELGYHSIQNMFRDQEGKMGNSQVYVYLSISNVGDKPIGITKILVRSKDPKYLIAVSSYEGYKINWKNHPVRSFRLEPQESKEIILFCEGNPIISVDKKFVEAEIEIYNVNYKVMKSIPVKLYIGSFYGGS